MIVRNHLSTTQPLIKQLVEEGRKLRQAVRAAELDGAAIRAQAARVAQSKLTSCWNAPTRARHQTRPHAGPARKGRRRSLCHE